MRSPRCSSATSAARNSATPSPTCCSASAEPGGRLPTTWPAERGRRPGPVHHPGRRRAGLRRGHPHRLPGLAQAGRRAGVLVRQRPGLHRHRPDRAPGRAAIGHRRGVVPGDRRGREPRRARRQAGRAGLRRTAGLRRRPPGALAGRVRADPRAGRREGDRCRSSVPTRLLAYWQDGWQYEPGRAITLRVGTSAVDLPLTVEVELA